MFLLYFYKSRSLSVVDVIDGDTVILSNQEKVRLLGIDSPELHAPNIPIQFYAQIAKDSLAFWALHQSVKLTYERHRRDQYDRLLAYVTLAGEDTSLNQKMVRSGLAFVYTRFPFGKSAEFLETQSEALQAERGIWQSQFYDSLLTITNKRDIIKQAFKHSNRVWPPHPPQPTPQLESPLPQQAEAHGKPSRHYIGNSNSKVVHRFDCSSIQRTKEKNRVYFNDLDSALQQGYKKCSRCLKKK